MNSAMMAQLIQHLVLSAPKKIGNRPTLVRYDSRDNYFLVIVEFEHAENLEFRVTVTPEMAKN